MNGRQETRQFEHKYPKGTHRPHPAYTQRLHILFDLSCYLPFNFKRSVVARQHIWPYINRFQNRGTGDAECQKTGWVTVSFQRSSVRNLVFGANSFTLCLSHLRVGIKSLPLIFPDKYFVRISNLSHECYYVRPSHSPGLKILADSC
jgi:hypothetical protein